MKIRKHTCYNTYSNLILHYLDDGLKIYTVYIKNPYNRSNLSEYSSYIKYKNKTNLNRCFRIYNNLYIKLSEHGFSMSFNVI